jgi:hypothetical protein
VGYIYSCLQEGNIVKRFIEQALGLLLSLLSGTFSLMQCQLGFRGRIHNTLLYL